MMIGTAFRKAFRVFFGNPGASLKFWTAEFCMTLASLTPMLFLTNEGTRMAALLAVPLYLLLMLPARW